jgi:hypothetical protein
VSALALAPGRNPHEFPAHTRESQREQVTALTPIVLDLLILLILAFCVWQGYRKGFILSLSGFLILIVALWGASFLSDRFVDPVTERIHPLLDWVTDDATERASRSEADAEDSEARSLSVAREAFSLLGVSEEEVDALADKVLSFMDDSGVSVRAGVSAVFIRTLAWVILFLFFLAIISLLLTLLAHFIGMMFELPGLKLLDTVGGLAAGLAHGCLILFAIGWGLRFLGILIPAELIGETVLTRFFVQTNPLTLFLS